MNYKKMFEDLGNIFKTSRPKKKIYLISISHIAPIYSTDFILSNIDLTKQKMTLFRIRLSLSYQLIFRYFTYIPIVYS